MMLERREKIDHGSPAAQSAHQLSDASRSLESDTVNLPQRGFVGRDDTLHRSEMEQQAVSQRWTDAWQALKHIESSRPEALWFSIVPLKDTGLGSGQLFCEKPQDQERVLRIARVNHRKPPHHRQRD